MIQAAIVGCGNIAGFLDSPTDNHITTHAHAYMQHPETNLIAVCDPNSVQRNKLKRKWGENIHTYASVNEMLQSQTVDILSICSPTAFHFEAMKEALSNKNIKTIICEKPFVQTKNELNALIELLKTTNKTVIINFMRRYDPSIQRVHTMIKNDTLGKLVSFNGKFTKGLYHNGSHMLELVEHLCGDISLLRSNECLLTKDDYYGNFFLETKFCKGVLQNFSGDNFALFELEIILSSGRIVIKDSGHTIHIETVQPSAQYAGYFSLQQKETLADTMNMNLLNTLYFALQSKQTEDALDQHLTLSKKLLDIKAQNSGTFEIIWKT